MNNFRYFSNHNEISKKYAKKNYEKIEPSSKKCSERNEIKK